MNKTVANYCSCNFKSDCNLTHAEAENSIAKMGNLILATPIVMAGYICIGFWLANLLPSINLFTDVLATGIFALLLMVVHKVSKSYIALKSDATTEGAVSKPANSEDTAEQNSSKMLGFEYIGFFLGAGFSLLLIRMIGDYWWIGSAIFSVLFAMLSIYTQSVLNTEQSFSKPISNMKLSKKLYSLADQAGFPHIEIHQYTGKVDEKTKHICVTPTNKTSRVLFTEKMLNELSTDEVCALFAHELGHLKGHHLKIRGTLQMFFAVLRPFSLALLVSVFASTTSSAFALLGLLLAIGSGSLVFFPIMETFFSRVLEKGADKFALELTKDATSFSSGLRTVVEAVPGSMKKCWVTDLYSTHPHPQKRFDYAARWQKKNSF